MDLVPKKNCLFVFWTTSSRVSILSAPYNNLFGWIRLIAKRFYCYFVYFFFFCASFWWLQFMPYLLRCEPIWAIALKVDIHFTFAQFDTKPYKVFIFKPLNEMWWSRDCTVGISWFSFSASSSAASTSRRLWAHCAKYSNSRSQSQKKWKSKINCQTKAHHFN